MGASQIGKNVEYIKPLSQLASPIKTHECIDNESRIHIVSWHSI